MLLFRLALRLGRTIRELESSITYAELDEWMVFDAIEPIGDARFDALAARICAAASGYKLPEGFTPKWDSWIKEALIPEEVKQEIANAQFVASMKMLAASMSKKKPAEKKPSGEVAG